MKTVSDSIKKGSEGIKEQIEEASKEMAKKSIEGIESLKEQIDPMKIDSVKMIPSKISISKLRDFAKGLQINSSTDRLVIFQGATMCVLILANILTFYSLKSMKRNKENKYNDTVFVYVLVYIYTLIYVVIMLFGLKWLCYVSEIMFSLDSTLFIHEIDDMIKDSFMNVLYIFPIYMIIPVLAISLDVDLLYLKKGNEVDTYSVYFQLILCLMQLVLYYSFRNMRRFEEKDMLKYMILAVTALSIGQQATLDEKNITKTLSTIIDKSCSFFLNINTKMLLILSPFILTGIMFVLYVINKNMLDLATIGIKIFASSVLIIGCLLIFEILKRSSYNLKDGLKEVIVKNASFIFYFQWFFNVLIYSSPILIMSAIQKDTKILNVFQEIFNVMFLTITFIMIIILTILQMINPMNINTHRNIVSALLIFVLALSNYK
jgi:hypothetical protein